jgi:uncharacterized protein (DUF952 family)
MLIYKIVHFEEWPVAEARGEYAGSAKDRTDGFLHFSNEAQLPGTLARYYAKEKDLVLVAVEADALGDALKFEPSTAGELYPHLYAKLSVSAVKWARALKRGPYGEFVLPI